MLAESFDSYSCKLRYPTNKGIGWPWIVKLTHYLLCPLSRCLLGKVKYLMKQSKPQNIEIRIMEGFEGLGLSTNPKYFKLLLVDATQVVHGDSFLSLNELVLPFLDSVCSLGPQPLFHNVYLKLIIELLSEYSIMLFTIVIYLYTKISIFSNLDYSITKERYMGLNPKNIQRC